MQMQGLCLSLTFPEGLLGWWQSQFPTGTGSPQTQGDRLTFRPRPLSTSLLSHFPNFWRHYGGLRGMVWGHRGNHLGGMPKKRCQVNSCDIRIAHKGARHSQHKHSGTNQAFRNGHATHRGAHTSLLEWRYNRGLCAHMHTSPPAAQLSRSFLVLGMDPRALCMPHMLYP